MVRYDDFDVTLSFTDGFYTYYANVSHEKGIIGGEYPLTGVFNREFEEFYQLFEGKQRQSYSEFIAPVFVIDAIMRSMESGKEESVHSFEEI